VTFLEPSILKIFKNGLPKNFKICCLTCLTLSHFVSLGSYRVRVIHDVKLSPISYRVRQSETSLNSCLNPLVNGLELLTKSSLSPIVTGGDKMRKVRPSETKFFELFGTLDFKNFQKRPPKKVQKILSHFVSLVSLCLTR
jgi:hypothetical protein